jgi:hypothetical protein
VAKDRFMNRFVVNGVEYKSLEEMPPDVRALFNEDGSLKPPTSNVPVSSTVVHTYNFNGVDYSSLEEMPPAVRAFFEDKNKDGIPDIAQQRGGLSFQAETPFSRTGRSSWTLVLLGFIAGLLLAAALLWALGR